MKIRDKLITSFVVVVFLLLVSVAVEFFAIRGTWKQLAAATERSERLGASDEGRLVGEGVKAHLLGRLERLSGLPKDPSPLLLLDACREMTASLAMARRCYAVVPTATSATEADRLLASADESIARLIARSDVFAARDKAGVASAEAFRVFQGGAADPAEVLRLLNAQRETADLLGNLVAFRIVGARIRESFGEPRFESMARVGSTRREAVTAYASFAAALRRSGLGGVGDTMRTLEGPVMELLGTETPDECREAWGKVRTACGNASGLLPPPGAAPGADALRSALDAVERTFSEYVKARVALGKQLQAGSWSLGNFEKEAANAEGLVRRFEVSLIKVLTQRLGGAEGLAQNLSTEIVTAVESLPVDTLQRASAGAALTALHEKQSWSLLYDSQLQSLTVTTVLFVVGLIVAVVLAVLVHRDVSRPLEILKTSLNNLCMGGEKRRINLKLPNEFGGLIEAYNRYLDNLTSTSKRLVECPSCRNPYEMGDSFCRQCGRKLRFDS